MTPTSDADRDDRKRARPIKDCGGAFCGNSGPYTASIVYCEADERVDAVGWCELCGRYVCGGCAIRTPASELDLATHFLACRYCGSALGTAGEKTRASDLTIDDDVHEPLDENEPSDEAWRELFADLVRRGKLTTAGLRDAKAHAAAGHPDAALEQLAVEENLCREAEYEAGLAHCELERMEILDSLGRREEAFRHAKIARRLGRSIDDDSLLSRAILGCHLLNPDGRRPADERLAELEELAARSRSNPRLKDFCVDRIVRIHSERGDVVGIVRALLTASEAAVRLEQLTELYRAQSGGEGTVRARFKSGAHDEATIRAMRTSFDVWGCQNGCSLPGTLGIVGLPKGQTVARLPCPICGTPYACLNDYSELSASVPDRQPASFMNPGALLREARSGVAIANLCLVVHDGGHGAQAGALRDLAMEEWRRQLGADSVAFASCANMLGRLFQDRDAHAIGRELCAAAAFAATRFDPPRPLEHASFLNNVGLSLACAGDYDGAESTLRESLALHAGFANPHYWLAKVYAFRRSEGDSELEAQAWRDYLSAGPSSPLRAAEAAARLASLTGEAFDGSGDRPVDPAAAEDASAASLEAATLAANAAVDEAISREAWDEALPLLEALSRAYRSRGNSEALVETLIKEADVHRLRDDAHAALDAYQEIETLSRRADRRGPLILSLCGQARLLKDRDYSKTLDLAAEAQALSKLEVQKLDARSTDRSSPAYRQAAATYCDAIRCFDEIGRALAEVGQVVFALSVFEHAARYREEYLLQAPDDRAMRLESAAISDDVARLIAKTPDRVEEARRVLQAGLDQLRRLDRDDPDGVDDPVRARVRADLTAHLGDLGL